jgi:retron-type reverse transcriptase
VPQGGAISPLLANIYAHALDALWERDASHLGQLIRYADDGAPRRRGQEAIM